MCARLGANECLSLTDYTQDEKALKGACDCTQGIVSSPVSVWVLMFFISYLMLCSSIFCVQHVTTWLFDFWLAPLFLFFLFLSFSAVAGSTVGDKHTAAFVIVRILFSAGTKIPICLYKTQGVRSCSEAEFLINCLMSACSEGNQRFQASTYTPAATYAVIYCTSEQHASQSCKCMDRDGSLWQRNSRYGLCCDAASC